MATTVKNKRLYSIVTVKKKSVKNKTVSENSVILIFNRSIGKAEDLSVG